MPGSISLLHGSVEFVSLLLLLNLCKPYTGDLKMLVHDSNDTEEEVTWDVDEMT
jgi:uncharacterized protein YhhL (DUF1145 family)